MASQAPADQGTDSIDDIERYEVIGGVRLEGEPMGAFETMLAPWLWHLLNSFAGDKNWVWRSAKSCSASMPLKT